MNRNPSAHRWALTAAVAMVTIAGLAACGDDEKADPTTTTVAETAAAYLDRVQAECPGFQPAFDDFYSQHPNPTAADYSEFLPSQIDGLSANGECIKASKPLADLNDEVGGVTDAFDLVIADVQKALDAAKADDLDGVNQWIGQMHDVDVAKIDAAIQAVVAAAGA